MNQPKASGITRLVVVGYRSLSQEQSIEIRPLTILAGANSSGKSSLMQPLLLLKQTLEATYDAGALLLNGPHVKVIAADQILSRSSKHAKTDRFSIGIEIEARKTLTTTFCKQPGRGFNVKQVSLEQDGEKVIWSTDMNPDEIALNIPMHIRTMIENIYEKDVRDCAWAILRHHCFLELELHGQAYEQTPFYPYQFSISEDVEPYILELIHLPGLRGNPERRYPRTATGPIFPGTFSIYTASVIEQWQRDQNLADLETLNSHLHMLGLNTHVVTQSINDSELEILVGRRVKGGKPNDLVNIADVGFGVSQILPVLVALLTAEPGQLVYIEQPEMHLHPRAQVALAHVLATVVQRGVKIVIETHSALLLLAIQTLVAEGICAAELVKLHWFMLDSKGKTTIKSTNLDKNGTFERGDWPEDFSDVEMEAESRFLDAVEIRYGLQ